MFDLINIRRQISSLMPAVLLLASLVLTGCINSGAFYSASLTNVELSEPNYRVVATNLQGQADAGYLFGVSGSQGGFATTFALFRVAGDGLLYKSAIENLWSGFEASHGAIGNRRLALINVHFDADASNYLGIYSKSMVSVRADIIEFE